MKSKINKNIFERSSSNSSEEAVEAVKNPEAVPASSTNSIAAEKIHLIVEAIKAGQLEARADLGGVSGADREILKDINEMLDVLVEPLNLAIEYTGMISTGNTPEKITDKYQGDFNQLKNNFNSSIDLISRIVDEFGVLINGVQEGKTDIRADSEKFSGVWRKILRGTNDVLDSLVAPTNMAAEYIDRIGRGDIPEKITDEYAGDFNEIKNSINACIDGLGGLVESSDVLRRMAVNDYNREVKGEYQGIFAETTESVNEVRQRLLNIQNISKKIAVGDYYEWLETLRKIGQRSQADEIIPALITMMENIDGLSDAVINLTNAAEEGKLDYRADTVKFEGKFNEVIQGVNNAVDAFVGPLNLMADVIARISNGDALEEVDKGYRGDFKIVENNINNCKKIVHGLVNETYHLTDAAAEGKLDVRGKADNFPGGWRGVIEGINNTIDAFVAPLNMTAEYVDRISKGDIPEKITDEYQ